MVLVRYFGEQSRLVFSDGVFRHESNILLKTRDTILELSATLSVTFLENAVKNPN